MSGDGQERRKVIEDAAPGVPLAAIFVFTAFCCVVAGLLFHAVRAQMAREADIGQLLVTTVLGAICGLFLGAMLGLMQRAPLVGMLIGGPTGFVLGAVTAPLVMVPTSDLGSMMTTTMGGSALILITAVVIRALGARAS